MHIDFVPDNNKNQNSSSSSSNASNSAVGVGGLRQSALFRAWYTGDRVIKRVEGIGGSLPEDTVVSTERRRFVAVRSAVSTLTTERLFPPRSCPSLLLKLRCRSRAPCLAALNGRVLAAAAVAADSMRAAAIRLPCLSVCRNTHTHTQNTNGTNDTRKKVIRGLLTVYSSIAVLQ